MKLTTETRAKLKSEYPSVKLTVATVKDRKGTEHDFVFQEIDRETSDISSKEVQNSPNKALEIEMTNSCVFGDKTIVTNDLSLFNGLRAKWRDIQKPCEVRLGEL